MAVVWGRTMAILSTVFVLICPLYLTSDLCGEKDVATYEGLNLSIIVKIDLISELRPDQLC